MNPLSLEIDGLLERDGLKGLQTVLDCVLGHFDCQVGTIHMLEPADGRLKLLVQRGIPDVIMDQVRDIPVGKGMAGLAAQRLAPVQVCNLQTDTSGKAKPGARETKMEGSLAVPILVAGQLQGTLGVAKSRAYDFTEAETKELLDAGSRIGAFLAHRPAAT